MNSSHLSHLTSAMHELQNICSAVRPAYSQFHPVLLQFIFQASFTVLCDCWEIAISHFLSFHRHTVFFAESPKSLYSLFLRFVLLQFFSQNLRNHCTLFFCVSSSYSFFRRFSEITVLSFFAFRPLTVFFAESPKSLYSLFLCFVLLQFFSQNLRNHCTLFFCVSSSYSFFRRISEITVLSFLAFRPLTVFFAKFPKSLYSLFLRFVLLQFFSQNPHNFSTPPFL